MDAGPGEVTVYSPEEKNEMVWKATAMIRPVRDGMERLLLRTSAGANSTATVKATAVSAASNPVAGARLLQIMSPESRSKVLLTGADGSVSITAAVSKSRGPAGFKESVNAMIWGGGMGGYITPAGIPLDSVVLAGRAPGSSPATVSVRARVSDPSGRPRVGASLRIVDWGCSRRAAEEYPVLMTDEMGWVTTRINCINPSEQVSVGALDMLDPADQLELVVEP